ncbi:cytochrome P450 4C1 [Bombyx mori]|uniref:Cytochrome P450 n=1 Tax=Bombyx mori TaxID=7091 RepID=A0A8R2R223_BOMMO|nr:cytochrome P450 4C1 [Bombyx mori]
MKGFQMIGNDAIKRGGMSCYWHGNRLFVVSVDPVELDVILKNCLEKDDLMKFSRILTGNGSIFAPVNIWHRRRKLLNPHFGTKNQNNFMETFIKQSAVLVNNLRKEADNGTFSVWDYLTAYTLDSVCEATLGVQMNSQAHSNLEFLRSFDVCSSLGAARICQPWLHSDIIYHRLQRYKTYQKNTEYVLDFVKQIVQSKRRQVENEPDSKTQCDKQIPTSDNGMKTVLELLILNKTFNDVELQEEAFVMIIAGTDTSAIGISFTLLMLARYPDVQEKVYQEIQELFGDSERPPEVEDIHRLLYLDAVIKEAMRLYPPAPVIIRKVERETKLPSGLILPRDIGILIPIWSVNRNPKYWGDDADVFRPERFLDGTKKHPTAFMTFSQGPRACLGFKFAMNSAKAALASILRHYRIKPPSELTSMSPGQYPPIRVKFALMTRDVDNFRIQLESRS